MNKPYTRLEELLATNKKITEVELVTELYAYEKHGVAGLGTFKVNRDDTYPYLETPNSLLASPVIAGWSVKTTNKIQATVISIKEL